MQNKPLSYIGCSLFVSFLLSILMLLLLSGCGKKPVTSTTNTLATDSLKREIQSLTEINKEIRDNTAIKLPEVKTANPDCDSLCNIEVNRVMGLLNREIVSGNNKFSMLYNEHQRLLNINTKVGETKSHNTSEKTEKAKYFLTTCTRTIKEAYIPAFYKYSAYLGWIMAIYFLYKLTRKIKSIWLPKKQSLL